PHPGIGRARRMQVARPAEQHQVMIEAVENHMPEVIVIDEIGTELEAQAARTIAERGVQLVGTAHGRTLDNLLVNPTLSDLVGGVQAVTLGDEEARRRGTQKTVLERKAPPTFDVLVEQEERFLVGVHHNVALAVDELLRGEAPRREMRERQADGSIRRWVEHAPREAHGEGVGLPTREAPPRRDTVDPPRAARSNPLAGQRPADAWWESRPERERPRRGSDRADRANRVDRAGRAPGQWLDSELALGADLIERDEPITEQPVATPPAVFRKRRIFPFGVSRNRLEQAIRDMGLPAVVSRTENDADAMLVLKNMYRRQPDRIDAAQAAGLPVYVLRGASIEGLHEALTEVFHDDLERARRMVTPETTLSAE
ncbi:MAG TPA: AAA family ATPase, partial [Ktedonobacterales bacterium]|nr:AAA family ATPase [Ktedonobacterales bacterium]